MSAGAIGLMSRIMNSSVEMNEKGELNRTGKQADNTGDEGEVSSFRSILASLQDKGEADRIEENVDILDELELDEEEQFSLLVILADADPEKLEVGELDSLLSMLAEIDLENLDTDRIAEITGLEAEELSRLLKMLLDSDKADGDLRRLLAEIDLENLDKDRIAEMTGLDQDEVESLIEEISSLQVENPDSQEQKTISWEEFQSMISQYDSSADEGLFEFLSEKLELDELDADEISRLLESFSAGEETDDGKISSEELMQHLKEEYNLETEELSEIEELDVDRIVEMIQEIDREAGEEIDTEVNDVDIWRSKEVSKREVIQHLREEYDLEREELIEIFKGIEDSELTQEELENLLQLLADKEAAIEQNSSEANTAEVKLTDLIENSEITEEIRHQQTSRQANMQTFKDELVEFLAEEYDLDPEKIEKALAEVDMDLTAEDKSYLQVIAEITESLESELSQLKLEESPARLAYKVWSELAAEVEGEVSELDMNFQEFLQSLEVLPEETADILSRQDLAAMSSGDWQELAASLLGNNRGNSREFQLQGELRENLDTINSELAPEEAITAVESASGEESGLDLESLLLNSGQMNTTGTDSAAGEAAANTQPAQIMDRVIDSIRVMQQQDMNSMTLKLEPEFLGRINLEVAVENGEVIAHLLVENDFVRRELDNNLNLLQRNLTREGFEIDQLTIESREEDSSLQYEQGSTDQRQQQEDSQGFRRQGQFQDEFQPEIADRISSLETDEAGDVDSNLRNWLLWKQYQYTWA